MNDNKRAAAPPEPWSRLARLYNLQLPLEQAALRAAVKLAEPQRHDRVLDVGTGTGAVLRQLARLPNPPAIAIGIDPSAKMLARAAAAQLPSPWTLELGDGRALRFEDGSFDLVFLAYLVNVISRHDAEQTLREIRRVLTSEGRAVIVSAVAPRSFLRRPYRWLWSRMVPLSHLVDPLPLLAAAGLSPRRSERVSLGYPSICVLATSNSRP